MPITDCDVDIVGVSRSERSRDLLGRSLERPIAVTPGKHVLRIAETNSAIIEVPIEIRAGEETRVSLVLRRGIGQGITIVEDAPGELPFRPHVVIKNSAGRVVLDWEMLWTY